MNDAEESNRVGLTHSLSIAAIAEALALAQGEMSGAKKSNENPFFKSKYADLASVIGAIRDSLSKYKIAHTQAPGRDLDGNFVDTMLIHSSGEWLKSRIYMNPIKNDPQGIGSVITYQRRYALQAMVGLEADDDDGNHATHRDSSKNLPKTQPLPPGSFENVKTMEILSVAPGPIRTLDQSPNEPVITKWQDILYTSRTLRGKPASKRLGELPVSFVDELWTVFKDKKVANKEDSLLKVALAQREMEKAPAKEQHPADRLLKMAEQIAVSKDDLLKIAKNDLDDPAADFNEITIENIQYMIDNFDKTKELTKDQLP